jgi:Calcineurin-like phosphoesterase
MNAQKHVVLHLTDLHFGQDTAQDQIAARDLALRGLVKVIERLESDWHPTVVCISGDIGWKGSQNDYILATQWLGDLLGNLGLSPDRVYICPGNHDIDRQISQRYARPKTGPEADRILTLPLAQVYQDAFKEFALFAKNFGIPPYRLGDQESYLIGQRSTDDLVGLRLEFGMVLSRWGRPEQSLDRSTARRHAGVLSPTRHSRRRRRAANGGLDAPSTGVVSRR